MSMFLCPECDQMRDSDQGCEEIGRRLVCEECAIDLTDAEEDEADEGAPIK